MAIIRRLFRMFSGGGGRTAGHTHTHTRGGGVATRSGGGIGSIVRRFLRR